MPRQRINGSVAPTIILVTGHAPLVPHNERPRSPPSIDTRRGRWWRDATLAGRRYVRAATAAIPVLLYVVHVQLGGPCVGGPEPEPPEPEIVEREPTTEWVPGERGRSAPCAGGPPPRRSRRKRAH